MSDESDRKLGEFNNVPIIFEDPFQAVRPSFPAENQHIANQGILFHHYMALPDPMGKKELGSIRQTFGYQEENLVETEQRFHRENGFIYVRAGEVYGTFMNNNKQYNNLSIGMYGESGALISVNRFYKGTEKKLAIDSNDKLVPCELPAEFFSVNYQEFIHNPSGIDRMQFSVCEVVFLIDNDGIQYHPGIDFELEKGYLKWIDGGNRPGLDKDTNAGKLCSIRYTYKPYYYVKHALHHIRIRPALMPDGSIQAKAGPVLVMVQADWVYLDRRTGDGDNPAEQLVAPNGENTGPR